MNTTGIINHLVHIHKKYLILSEQDMNKSKIVWGINPVSNSYLAKLVRSEKLATSSSSELLFFQVKLF